MKLMEVAEHPLMVLVNSKLAKNRAIEIDIDVEVEWPKPGGGSEVLVLEPRWGAQVVGDHSGNLMGQLVGVEKRGQSMNMPTVVLHVIEPGTGEDRWHYIYEWALDYLTLKPLEGRLLLTNRQPA